MRRCRIHADENRETGDSLQSAFTVALSAQCRLSPGFSIFERACQAARRLATAALGPAQRAPRNRPAGFHPVPHTGARGKLETMRGFLTRRTPPFTRVLLIESGSRALYETLLPGLYKTHDDNIRVDLATCYGGVPEGFRTEAGAVYRVTGYPGRGRKRLYRELLANRYTVAGMICSAEPIMTKWKWALALRLPSKVFVLNENGDYFWLDWGHWKVIRHFVAYRAGLTGSGAVRTIARLLLFPLTLLYLLLYAAAVHLRRRVRLMLMKEVDG